MRSQRLSLLLTLLLCSVAGRAQDQGGSQAQVINGIAAVVNGDVITFSQVQEIIVAQEKSATQIYHGDELQQKIKVMRQQAIKDLIDRSLILQEFHKKEFTIPEYIVDDGVQRIIRQDFGGDRAAFVRTLQAQGFTMARFRQVQRDKIIVQAMRQAKTSENVIVSPVKIREYYEKNIASYTTPEQVKLRMIVLQQGASTGDASSDANVDKKQMADEIHEKLAAGGEFDRLAQMYSDDSTKEAGGDWGWIERKTLNEELAKIAFSLKKGEISPVVPLDNSYYILMAEDKKPTVTKPLSEVQGEIVNNLVQQEKLKAQDRWLQGLRKQAYIKIYN
jgi:peptidyl-prolyl cis-trans isomerase SurA